MELITPAIKAKKLDAMSLRAVVNELGIATLPEILGNEELMGLAYAKIVGMIGAPE